MHSWDLIGGSSSVLEIQWSSLESWLLSTISGENGLPMMMKRKENPEIFRMYSVSPKLAGMQVRR